MPDAPAARCRRRLFNRNMAMVPAIAARAATPPTAAPAIAPVEMPPDDDDASSSPEEEEEDVAEAVALCCTTPLAFVPQAAAVSSSRTGTNVLEVAGFPCHSVKLLAS